ncbi:MAG: hypothetical protein AB7N54_13635 [Alphaproteobacteria bacterium]
MEAGAVVRCLRILAPVALLLPAAPSLAQSTSPEERLAQLERQVRALERTTSQGGPVAAAANNNERDAEMAAAIRDLIGRVEELDFEFRRLNERIEKLAATANDRPTAGSPPANGR